MVSGEIKSASGRRGLADPKRRKWQSVTWQTVSCAASTSSAAVTGPDPARAPTRHFGLATPARKKGPRRMTSSTLQVKPAQTAFRKKIPPPLGVRRACGVPPEKAEQFNGGPCLWTTEGPPNDCQEVANGKLRTDVAYRGATGTLNGFAPHGTRAPPRYSGAANASVGKSGQQRSAFGRANVLST